jgi:hypothetical protein
MGTQATLLTLADCPETTERFKPEGLMEISRLVSTTGSKSQEK